jgi:hypothetical protein
MDPILDARSHLFAARDTMGLDVLAQVRDAKQASATDSVPFTICYTRQLMIH